MANLIMKYFGLFGLIILSSFTNKLYKHEIIRTKENSFIEKKSGTVLGVGDEVNDFTLRSINGKNYSLATYPSAKGFIIVFASNYCPFSKSYEDRLMALDKKYSVKLYPVIAINPNDPQAYEEEKLENIQATSKEKGFTFSILIDEKQQVAKNFGATRTPHVFIVKKENGKYIIKYSGAIDDNPQDPAGITKNYVEDALANILENKPVINQQTKPIGCAIRWK
jgi:peroxiredoxin